MLSRDLAMKRIGMRAGWESGFAGRFFLFVFPFKLVRLEQVQLLLEWKQ